MKKIISENFKTLVYALIIAIIIRSFLYQPFYIPSSSMEPTLLIGDRIFVSKYSYGYSKHSFPFSPNFYSKRFFNKSPKRGDVIVFKTPQDNRTDYIKRLIGLPGDTIQFINGDLYLNDKKVERLSKIINIKINLPGTPDTYQEILPSGKKYNVVYSKEYNLNKFCKRLILMFQKEVADRIIAKSDSKDYGRLSILSNWKMKIEKIIDIEPSSFKPSPKIKSTLLVFTPKKKFFELRDPRNLEHITNIFFSQRRKMIKKPFKFLFKNYEEVSKNLSIDLNLRPQNLDCLTYYKICEIYEALTN